MFLKNYTSNVPVSQTLERIDSLLVRCGATSIAKEYSGGSPPKVIAVTFRIPIPDGPQVNIRLPANEAQASEALWLDYAGDDLQQNGNFKWGCRKSKTRKDFVQQGERTAWKLVLDWIEVQMSMIQLKQAEPLQVFLPYVWDGKRTYYDALKSGHFQAMLPEKGS